MFALVFAELTGIVVERPRFCYFRCNQLDYDVHRLHPVEIIREMGTDTERGLAILLRIALDFDGTCRVERVAEYHLLRPRVNAQRAIFLHNPHQLLVIVATIYTQALEQVGKVF